AHAIVPVTMPPTGAFGMLFGALGMSRGWPVVRGGTGQLVKALLSVLHTHGGRVHLNHEVTNLAELPAADAIVLNLTPAQVLRVTGTTDEAGSQLARPTRRRLRDWRYGTAAYRSEERRVGKECRSRM